MDGRRSHGRSYPVWPGRPWLIHGPCLALLLLIAGCVATRNPEDRVTPELLAQRAELNRVAQDAMDRSDWPTARQSLEQLILISPRSAEAYQRLGQVLQSQGDYPNAETAYRKALDIDHDYAAALVGLGETEARLGRLQTALAKLEEAAEIDPRRSRGHLIRGQVLEGLGRNDEAIAAYFRALEFESNSIPATVAVAKLQIDRGQPDQALARIDQAIQQTPKDPEARHQRGRALLALNKNAEAISDLKLAAETLVNRPDVYYDLARAFEIASPAYKAEALQAAQRAEALAPGWADARDLSARLMR